MKKNKTYKVTAWKIITSLFNSTIAIPIFTTLFIFLCTEIQRLTIIGFGIISLFPLFMIGYYGIYPAYLCWVYYKHDKNKKIYIDYEKSELQYITDDEVNKVIKFDDIIRIKKNYRFSIGLWYYRVISKYEETLTVTSLLATSFDYVIPSIQVERMADRSNLLLPKSKEKQ